MGEKGLNNRAGVSHAGAFNHQGGRKQYRRGRGCRAGLWRIFQLVGAEF